MKQPLPWTTNAPTANSIKLRKDANTLEYKKHKAPHYQVATKNNHNQDTLTVPTCQMHAINRTKTCRSVMQLAISLGTAVKYPYVSDILKYQAPCNTLWLPNSNAARPCADLEDGYIREFDPLSYNCAYQPFFQKIPESSKNPYNCGLCALGIQGM